MFVNLSGLKLSYFFVGRMRMMTHDSMYKLFFFFWSAWNIMTKKKERMTTIETKYASWSAKWIRTTWMNFCSRIHCQMIMYRSDLKKCYFFISMNKQKRPKNPNRRLFPAIVVEDAASTDAQRLLWGLCGKLFYIWNSVFFSRKTDKFFNSMQLL